MRSVDSDYLRPAYQRHFTSILASAVVLLGIATGAGGAAGFQYLNNQPLSIEETAMLTGLALWVAQKRQVEPQAVMSCLTEHMGVNRLSNLPRGDFDRAKEHLLRVGNRTTL